MRRKKGLVYLDLRTNVWLKRLAYERGEPMGHLMEDILEQVAQEYAGILWDEPLRNAEDIRGWRARPHRPGRPPAADRQITVTLGGFGG